MAEIKTRLQVLNDTAEALAEKATAVPLKGEIVYDQTNHKMKIGDGKTTLRDLKFVGGDEAKHFDVVANAGEEDVAAILRVVGDAEIHTGDTAIVKRTIINDKISHTAYVYNGTNWAACDGNYNAKNVYFDADLTLTETFGKYKPGASGSIDVPSAGQSVYGLIDDAFAQEKNPTATPPSASVTISGGYGTFEIGTKKNLTYSASLNGGSYTYGPNPTGVAATGYTVTCDGKTADTATGSFENIVADGTKKISVSITHSAGNIPKTNKGKEYAAAQIKAGTKTATSSQSLVGVRHMFYGVVKSADFALDSAHIRGLNHEAAAKKTISTFTAGDGALKVVVACPAGYNVTKVTLPSAMGADATADFVKQGGTVQVEGAEGYTAAAYSVWVFEPASIPSSQSYSIVIG